MPGAASAWAQYTLKVDDRERLAELLRVENVPTAKYYPRPLHQQPAFHDFPTSPGGLPTSERLSESVLSLPMHPYLDLETQQRIVAVVRQGMSEAFELQRSDGRSG